MVRQTKSPIHAEVVDNDNVKQAKDPGHAVARIDTGPTQQLTMYRKPADVLAEAGEAAKALLAVIKAKPDDKKVMMNGVQYLVCEDWQLVGNFYGTVPKIRQTDFVQYDLGAGLIVSGYRAICDLIHIKTREVISSAEAMCLNDEPKWSTKAKYVWGYICKDGSWSADDPGPSNIVWEDSGQPDPKRPGKNKSFPKKERRHVGDERVPLFQLMSMAQTRAESKVLRVVFSHIVVLAGFGATPAEELDNDIPTSQPVPQANGEKPKQARKDKAAPKPSVNSQTEPDPPEPPPTVEGYVEPPPPGASPNGGIPYTEKTTKPKCISPAMAKRFWVIARTNEWTNEEVHALLLKEAKVDHTEDIPVGKVYNRLCDEILPAGPKKAGYRG